MRKSCLIDNIYVLGKRCLTDVMIIMIQNYFGLCIRNIDQVAAHT